MCYRTLLLCYYRTLWSIISKLVRNGESPVPPRIYSIRYWILTSFRWLFTLKPGKHWSSWHKADFRSSKSAKQCIRNKVSPGTRAGDTPAIYRSHKCSVCILLLSKPSINWKNLPRAARLNGTLLRNIQYWPTQINPNLAPLWSICPNVTPSLLFLI